MKPELWMWVYDGQAHGYYDTAEEAQAVMHESLHWTRQADAVIAKVVVDRREAA